MRRVVTGHDEEGKSIVVLDGPQHNLLEKMLVDYLNYGIPMAI